MIDREFPVLGWNQWRREERQAVDAAGCPRSVPWQFLQPHEPQALANHDQTLQRLAERGGLSPAEMLCVVEDRRWKWGEEVTDHQAVPLLLAHLAKWKDASQ